MSRGVNKVILIGNLGADPEVRFTQSGLAMANLSIATSESWRDDQGNQQTKTEWHRVVLFRRLAEIAQQYLKKGSKVYIEGKLQTRKWQAQDGSDRYSTEVVGNELQMLDGASGGQGNQGGDWSGQQQGGYGRQQQGGQGQGGYNQQPAQSQGGGNPSWGQSQQSQQNQQPAQQSGGADQGGYGGGDFSGDDDIPF